MMKYYLQIKADNSVNIASSSSAPDIGPTDIVKQAELDEKPVGDFRYDPDTSSLIFLKSVGSGVFDEGEEIPKFVDDNTKVPLIIT